MSFAADVTDAEVLLHRRVKQLEARLAIEKDRVARLREAISRAQPYTDGHAHEVLAKAWWDDGGVAEQTSALVAAGKVA